MKRDYYDGFSDLQQAAVTLVQTGVIVAAMMAAFYSLSDRIEHAEKEISGVVRMVRNEQLADECSKKCGGYNFDTRFGCRCLIDSDALRNALKGGAQ